MSTAVEIAYKNALDATDYILRELVNIDLAKSVINSVNDNQIKNKIFLVRRLRKYIGLSNNPDIAVVGGWYGLASYLIKDFYNVNVTNVDKDPMCKEIGKKIFPDLNHVTSSIEDFNFKGYSYVICPSCEHIEDSVINNMISRCDLYTVFILLSNNYKGPRDHINIKNDITEFKNSINLDIKDEYILELEKYNRFMIVGY